jgi:hypothetical protein
MAIAFDSSTQGYGSGNTLTVAHTCSGSNRILFVLAASSYSAVVVNSVTYGGQSMTKIASHSNGGAAEISLWYIVAPAIGSNNIVVTASQSSGLAVTTASYTGASQTGVPDAYQIRTYTGYLSSFSETMSSVADNCWFIWGAHTLGAAVTAGANTVVRQNELMMVGSFLADSGAPKTPAGSLTMTVNYNSQAYYSIMASFKPALASTGQPQFLLNFI